MWDDYLLVNTGLQASVRLSCILNAPVVAGACAWHECTRANRQLYSLDCCGEHTFGQALSESYMGLTSLINLMSCQDLADMNTQLDSPELLNGD